MSVPASTKPAGKVPRLVVVDVRPRAVEGPRLSLGELLDRADELEALALRRGERAALQ